VKFISRSLLVLVALYGMVFALGNIALASHRVSMWWAFAFSVGFIALQYVVSPWITESILSIDWDENELPAVNRQFIARLCAERGLPHPKIGVIHSGNPNAFCFGRVRSDARLVVTTGLLDVLTPDETNAVLAHELGHIEHYDFAIMAVAALAPLLLYQIYVWTDRLSNTQAIGWLAYLCYWIGQLLVLTLNRTREYHADHFSALVTRAPGDLSSALIKIAYGMVKSDGEYRESLRTDSTADKSRLKQERQLGGAIALMGIANLQSSHSLALAVADPAQAAAVMRWDLVNPWASFYQLSSTHPLTALRVRALNAESEEMHQQVGYPLPAAQPSDRSVRWISFPFELLLWAAPGACAVWLFLGYRIERIFALLHLQPVSVPVPWVLVVLGTTWMLRIAFRYHGTFTPAKIAPLLEDVEVSQMRPRAVELRGEIVGHGVPGAFWSADLVLRDDSGMIFVLYRSSIPLARLWFAMGSADRFIGEQVTLQGWYRRGLRPYIEISRMAADVVRVESGPGPISLFGASSTEATLTPETLVQRSYSRWIQCGCAALATAAGLIWLMHS